MSKHNGPPKKSKFPDRNKDTQLNQAYIYSTILFFKSKSGDSVFVINAHEGDHTNYPKKHEAEEGKENG